MLFTNLMSEFQLNCYFEKSKYIFKVKYLFQSFCTKDGLWLRQAKLMKIHFLLWPLRIIFGHLWAWSSSESILFLCLRDVLGAFRSICSFCSFGKNIFVDRNSFQDIVQPIFWIQWWFVWHQFLVQICCIGQLLEGDHQVRPNHDVFVLKYRLFIWILAKNDQY